MRLTILLSSVAIMALIMLSTGYIPSLTGGSTVRIEKLDKEDQLLKHAIYDTTNPTEMSTLIQAMDTKLKQSHSAAVNLSITCENGRISTTISNKHQTKSVHTKQPCRFTTKEAAIQYKGLSEHPTWIVAHDIQPEHTSLRQAQLDYSQLLHHLAYDDWLSQLLSKQSP